jgi:hypothetical protein
MALARTAARLMAPTTDERQEVDAMPKDEPTQSLATARAAGWAGVTLAIISVLGLVYVPAMKLIWIVILVLAASAVPQALIAIRLDDRKRDAKRDQPGR